jgi:hypothetical protein
MPKRTDIHKILIIGSGPIIISQACEFDYSGTQACKALKEEGYDVILVNSNPATIMTDPETADRTYVEPITPEAVEKIIAKDRPDALLPTLGGQTGLNTAVADGWTKLDNVFSLVNPTVPGQDFVVQVVPIPAAAWLLGSGLLGLFGLARRKTAVATA